MWPLPGGKHAWKHTLDEILEYVADTAPTWDQLIAWVVERFDKVASEKVARGCIVSVLRPLDLLETQGDRVVVTTAGVEYLGDWSSRTLLAIAQSRVAGFDEILDALDTGPETADALLDHLRATLDVGWQIDAQVKFRLGWLEVPGVVEEVDGKWKRTTAESQQ